MYLLRWKIVNGKIRTIHPWEARIVRERKNISSFLSSFFVKTSETRKRCLLGLISGVSSETRYIFQIFSFRVKFERSLIGYSKNAILSNVSILVDENPRFVVIDQLVRNPLRIESWPRSSLEITFDSSGNHGGRCARNTKIRIDPKRHWRNFNRIMKEGKEEIGNPKKMTNEFLREEDRSRKISRLNDDTFRRGHSSNFMVWRLPRTVESVRVPPVRCVHAQLAKVEISTKSLNLVYFPNPWSRK